MVPRLRRWAIVPAIVLLLLLGGAAYFHVPDPGGDAPRVLVSVDRSLWNAFGLNRLTYVRRLRLAGLSPEWVSYRDLDVDAAALLAGGGYRGLVLTGGGDVAPDRYRGDPAVGRGVSLARDSLEFALLESALDESLPVLGLCRGAQLINVHFGGSLGDLRDDAEVYGSHRSVFADHPVRLEADSKLADIYGGASIDNVTTWHGQHVERVGEGLRVVAYSLDDIPEAIESEDERFIVGVQWHAEVPPWDRRQQALFDAFAAAVQP